MTNTSQPTRLLLVSQALAEYSTARNARKAENKSDLDRATALLARILGEAAEQAELSDDFEGVLFELDDMQFLFVEGASAEDDYFQVSLFGLECPRAVRTLAGLGHAIDGTIEQIYSIAHVFNEPE